MGWRSLAFLRLKALLQVWLCIRLVLFWDHQQVTMCQALYVCVSVGWLIPESFSTDHGWITLWDEGILQMWNTTHIETVLSNAHHWSVSVFVLDFLSFRVHNFVFFDVLFGQQLYPLLTLSSHHSALHVMNLLSYWLAFGLLLSLRPLLFVKVAETRN